jgi:hypothetical protein
MKTLFKNLKNKKFLIFSVFSVLLSAVLVINITTALFFSETSTSTLITISDLAVSAEILNEPNGELNIGTQNLIPGESIERTLRISSSSNSESAYVRIQAIFEIDNGSGYEQTIDVQMQVLDAGANWATIEPEQPLWFYYTGNFLANSTIDVDLAFVVFPTAESSPDIEYGIGNEDANKDYRITLKVHAIQTANNGTNYSNATWPEV